MIEIQTAKGVGVKVEAALKSRIQVFLWWMMMRCPCLELGRPNRPSRRTIEVLDFWGKKCQMGCGSFHPLQTRRQDGVLLPFLTAKKSAQGPCRQTGVRYGNWMTWNWAGNRWADFLQKRLHKREEHSPQQARTIHVMVHQEQRGACDSTRGQLLPEQGCSWHSLRLMSRALSNHLNGDVHFHMSLGAHGSDWVLSHKQLLTFSRETALKPPLGSLGFARPVPTPHLLREMLRLAS